MEAFEGLSKFRRVVDDIIIYDKDEASHINHVWQFLQRCQEKHITLNKEKCMFSCRQVTFVGFKLSSEGTRLQRLKTKVMAFNLTAKCCKGDTNRAPDALSRYPVWEPYQSDSLAEHDEDNLPGFSAAEIRAIVNDNHNNIQIQELMDHAKVDETYIRTIKGNNSEGVARPQEPTPRSFEAILASVP